MGYVSFFSPFRFAYYYSDSKKLIKVTYFDEFCIFYFFISVTAVLCGGFQQNLTKFTIKHLIKQSHFPL